MCGCVWLCVCACVCFQAFLGCSGTKRKRFALLYSLQDLPHGNLGPKLVEGVERGNPPVPRQRAAVGSQESLL